MTRRSSFTMIVASIFMMLMSLLGTIRAANAGTWVLSSGNLSSAFETVTMNGTTTTSRSYSIDLTQNYAESTGTMDVRNNYTRVLSREMYFDWSPAYLGETPNLTPGFYGDKIASTFSINNGAHQCGTPKVTDTIGQVYVTSNPYTAHYSTTTTFSVSPYNPSPYDPSWYFGGHEISTCYVPF